MYEYVNGHLKIRWAESPGNFFIVRPPQTWATTCTLVAPTTIWLS